jgi:hypothetical protein
MSDRPGSVGLFGLYVTTRTHVPELTTLVFTSLGLGAIAICPKVRG